MHNNLRRSGEDARVLSVEHDDNTLLSCWTCHTMMIIIYTQSLSLWLWWKQVEAPQHRHFILFFCARNARRCTVLGLGNEEDQWHCGGGHSTCFHSSYSRIQGPLNLWLCPHHYYIPRADTFYLLSLLFTSSFDF